MSDDTVPIRALIIRADTSWEVTEVVPDFESGLYTLLDTDLIEGVGRHERFYFDQLGKQKAKPPNYLATTLTHWLGVGLAPGDVIAGTVVVFGPIRNSGDTAVTDQTLTVWRELLDALAAHRERAAAEEQQINDILADDRQETQP